MDTELRYDVFISGKYVDLFVLTEEHALYTDWYNWFNNAETMSYLEHHRFPNTPANQLEFYKTALGSSSKKLQLGIMDKNKVFIGIVSLGNIDYISQKADAAIIIGEKKYQKEIYTIEAMSLMLEHAFFTLNLRRIYGGAMAKWIADFWVSMMNATHEGMYRKHIYKNGTFHDTYLFGMLREEFSPM